MGYEPIGHSRLGARAVKTLALPYLAVLVNKLLIVYKHYAFALVVRCRDICHQPAHEWNAKT